MSGTGKLDGREREGRGLTESGRGVVFAEQEGRHKAAQAGPGSGILAGQKQEAWGHMASMGQC